MLRKVAKIGFIIFSIFLLIVVALGGLGVAYFYIRITRDLPRIEKVSDYQPKAVSSIVADDGTLIAKAWEDFRLPVKFDEIPQAVKNAFLAAEDANFYKHPGIDLMSIMRAAYKNFRNKASKQGASTITQQIVKSLLLTREKTYERKLKEAILSYRIENALSKDEIFSIYLNEIFLGANAYGVKAAAWMHFRKELKDLSLGEIAFLAGLPPRPSYLASKSHRKDSEARRVYVLEQMRKNEMITDEQMQKALAEKVEAQAPDFQTIYAAPYYAQYVLQELDERLKSVNPTWTAGNPGGFTIHTEANVDAYDIAQLELRKGLRELDKRRGWRGTFTPEQHYSNFSEDKWERTDHLFAEEVYPAKVLEINAKTAMARVRIGEVMGVVNLKKATWANRLRTPEDHIIASDLLRTIKPDSWIDVVLDSELEKAQVFSDLKQEAKLKLDQTPDIEGAFILLDPLTGQVKVVVGGYSFDRSNFNRATQALRQPGSSFKPIIYTAAVEYLNYTPTTMVPDSPISLTAGNGELWSPQNYDREFLGPITIRTALQRSRNVVSVHLLQRIGIDRIISLARKFGISTPIGRDMSISLGTAEVKPIELASAYGVFAARGWLAERIVISKIVDRQGKVVYEQQPKQVRVIPDDTAFIMANMMKGVVERGTATVVKKLGHPVAGKTGTTNEQMDAWFIGYTPEWVGAVWVGFDTKKSIGDKETGGRVSAPIFLHFMEKFLANDVPQDFVPPEGVNPVRIDLNSGTASNADDAFVEYFKSGTEPNTDAPEVKIPNDYLQSDEF
ncbi:MAG: PBP1A family penicillin-binding protein [Deltaproteobacteria bacterium]|nr:PBP1A family penicillin-binding protein [Deltaproteobacteria bacterium]